MRLYPPHPALTSQMADATRNLNDRLREVAGDVTSGRRFDQIGYLKGDIGQAMLAQRAVNELTLEKAQIALQGSRLAVIQASLGSVAVAADGIALDVQSALGLGDAVALERSSDDARVALERVFAGLGTRHGERYLFSGDATDTPPLEPVENLLADLGTLAANATTSADFEIALDAYFNSPDGGWRQDIYQGTHTDPKQDQVLAIDPAITELVSGLAVVSVAEQLNWGGGSVLPESTLSQAADRISNGIDGTTAVKARLGLVEERLDDRAIQIEQEETLAGQLLSDLTTRDPYEAAVELQQLEANLETAYALTSRLSELSLVRFLR